MFEVGNEYSFFEIKNSLGVKEGSAMLMKGKIFLALCLESGLNHIAPNLMLVKNGSLIRKIGRELANAKYPIYLFIKSTQNSNYKYFGTATVLETKTAPTKIKSTLQQHPDIDPKKVSRLVYLNIPKNSSQPTASDGG
ncbi:hypothetical protein QT917_000760 [Xanthomonas campestris pv. campestris]|uniref:hypothetical protein n=1 Tax=Xanthomonas campestris TaxID=339 RepID=UPI0025A276D0|nr:hypothetical protein [Xanthomonas campestris]MDM7702389.1 hypothetical protein [Xanthomonas campestris pv. campestris]MEA0907765.1 hypothetical protein [Xanthomonas campestris pv. campestris]MEB1944855.1 hypothetical protein [Xanthomonas campestris pv. campestris]